MAGGTLTTPRELLPRDAEEALRAAAALGLTIPAACLSGVIANLALLAHHADIFQAGNAS